MGLPILIVAFNRPELTKALLNQIERLKPRPVVISIDGDPRNNLNASFRRVNTLDVISRWASESKHEVNIRVQDENLGCNQHTLKAMEWFALKYEHGFLFEDDLEIQFQYLNFLDTLNISKVHESFEGVCSTNSDWSKDLANKNSQERVKFYASGLLSQTWGMTFSRDSVERIQSFQTNLHSISPTIKREIRKWSREIEGNFLLQMSLEKYWLGKYQRLLTTWDKSRSGYRTNNETGWDALLQFSAIKSQRNFLMPNWNCGRTSLLANVGAWHEWNPPYEEWTSLDFDLEFELDLDNVRIFPNQLDSLRFARSKYPVRAIFHRR